MSNVTFSGKSDTRNLMLPYGDSSSPLQKSLPSIGLREIFYDSSTDAILTRPVSIQY
jgi:NADH:ubiquinone oxidoreductase subunit C